ncbi:hypothetical protein Q0812_10395 [Brevundimonas sp. 2R-24]|uniref:Uncharacterized protein n=1 Tax=Peiella sedimenti TaxID=3061083 RepID=A0ABT8SNZ6_9CAUL|nr:hypothetical protein [Caulobacteraceae bacterium XZ-24]
MARGIYRHLPTEGGPATVTVAYDKAEMVLPEATYRERGYEPPFEELPIRKQPGEE